MSDQLVTTTSNELAAIVKAAIKSELSPFFTKYHQVHLAAEPVIYRSRGYVKNFLQTTYPTIRKYSKEGANQLLHPISIGRRLLYKDDELNLVSPKIRLLIDPKSSKKSAS